MLPFSMKQMPPNILRSVMPGRWPIWVRMRSAVSSEATDMVGSPMMTVPLAAAAGNRIACAGRGVRRNLRA